MFLITNQDMLIKLHKLVKQWIQKLMVQYKLINLCNYVK